MPIPLRGILVPRREGPVGTRRTTIPGPGAGRRWRLIPWLGVLVGLGSVSTLQAQRVVGRVVDQSTGDPLPFTYVALLGEGGATVRAAESDRTGFFLLDVEAGSYRLRATRLGYSEHLSDPLDLRSDETLSVVVRMAVQAIPMPPLEVVARGRDEPGRSGFERRMALGKGVFLTVDSIRARNPVLVSDAFHGIPGVVVFEGMGPVKVYSMYGAKCFIMFRDHFPVGEPVGTAPDLRLPTSGRPSLFGPTGSGPINERLKIDWIRGIEIYRDLSEVPQELRTANVISQIWPAGGRVSGGRTRYESCGLILIWTDLGW